MPNRNRRSHVWHARHPIICIGYRAPRASSTKSRQIQIKLVKLVSITVAWCLIHELVKPTLKLCWGAYHPQSTLKLIIFNKSGKAGGWGGGKMAEFPVTMDICVIKSLPELNWPDEGVISLETLEAQLNWGPPKISCFHFSYFECTYFFTPVSIGRTWELVSRKSSKISFLGCTSHHDSI